MERDAQLVQATISLYINAVIVVRPKSSWEAAVALKWSLDTINYKSPVIFA